PSGITPLPWVARTATQRLVLPLLQNRHSRHSAVYSGITWSPGCTLVTPSPTSTTMPAPSWPSTAGNTPSGSSPDSVKASVWQSAVWVIFTSTSPCFGPSRSSSTICSGFPASKATAARVFMVSTPAMRWRGWRPRRGGAVAAACGSFQIGTDQPGHFGDARLAIGRVGRRLPELLAQVRFEHLAHQSVHGAADGRDRLQHRAAVDAGFQRALQALALAADAADACQDLALFFGGMGQGGEPDE